MTTPYNAEGVDYPDSMLSRKFGREVVNYFAGKKSLPLKASKTLLLTAPPGSPLNRVSFLRGSNPFLRAALPASRILLLRDLEPLASSATNLAWVDYPAVSSLIGQPFDFEEEKIIEAYDSRTEIPTLVFLGLDEKKPEVFEYASEKGKYQGQPYFALDVTPKESYREKAEAIAEEATKKEGAEFRKVRIDLSLVPGDGIPSTTLRSLSGD